MNRICFFMFGRVFVYLFVVVSRNVSGSFLDMLCIYMYIYIYMCVCTDKQSIPDTLFPSISMHHSQQVKCMLAQSPRYKSHPGHTSALFHNFTHPSAIGHCLVHPLLMIRRGRLSQQLCQRHIIIILQPFLGIASIPQQDSFVVLLYGSCFYNILFTGVLLALLALLVLLTLLVLLVLSASAISSFLC